MGALARRTHGMGGQISTTSTMTHIILSSER